MVMFTVSVLSDSRLIFSAILEIFGSWVNRQVHPFNRLFCIICDLIGYIVCVCIDIWIEMQYTTSESDYSVVTVFLLTLFCLCGTSVFSNLRPIFLNLIILSLIFTTSEQGGIKLHLNILRSIFSRSLRHLGCVVIRV